MSCALFLALCVKQRYCSGVGLFSEVSRLSRGLIAALNSSALVGGKATID